MAQRDSQRDSSDQPKINHYARHRSAEFCIRRDPPVFFPMSSNMTRVSTRAGRLDLELALELEKARYRARNSRREALK